MKKNKRKDRRITGKMRKVMMSKKGMNGNQRIRKNKKMVRANKR